MNSLLRYFKIDLEWEKKRRLLYALGSVAILGAVVGFFDAPLAAGLLVLLFLSVATLFFLYKAGIRDTAVYAVLLFAVLAHTAAVFLIYYGHFRPFGGGADFEGYHQNAIDVAHQFSGGNFSLDGLGLLNYFPVLIGIVYLFSMPEVLVGQLFTVWLAALSVVLAYVIVLQIGGTKKAALWAGCMAVIYPSYLYFGSLLLKDTVVIPLVLLGMLLILKMIKDFSWSKLLVFLIVLTVLVNLRFYMGYALMFTLILSWPLLTSYKGKKKLAHWLAIIFILGFAPQIAGNGYYGLNSFKEFLNPEKITYYREIVYTANSPLSSQPTVSPQPSAPQPPASQPTGSQPTTPQPTAPKEELPKQAFEGGGSTFVLETGLDHRPVTFLKNSFQSFVYSLLGPFPWQFNNQRQLVGLAETVPWYLFIMMFLYHTVGFIKKNGISGFLKFYRTGFPLLLFSVLALGALSLFINNYGIIARIRIPMFICLVSFMSIMFNNVIENYYAKIYHYWRSRIHRLPFIKRTVGAGQ